MNNAQRAAANYKQIRIPNATHEALRLLAFKQNRPMTWVINALVKAELEREADKEQVLFMETVSEAYCRGEANAEERLLNADADAASALDCIHD